MGFMLSTPALMTRGMMWLTCESREPTDQHGCKERRREVETHGEVDGLLVQIVSENNESSRHARGSGSEERLKVVEGRHGGDRSRSNLPVGRV